VRVVVEMASDGSALHEESALHAQLDSAGKELLEAIRREEDEGRSAP
jgi:hypothetical protein